MITFVRTPYARPAVVRNATSSHLKLDQPLTYVRHSRHWCATDTRFTPPGRLQRAFPVTEQCRREMARLCRGGDFMYEGNFSY